MTYIKLTKECLNLFIQLNKIVQQRCKDTRVATCLLLTEMFVFLRWEWICKLTCVYSRGSEAIRKYKHTGKDRLRTNPFYQKLTYSHIPIDIICKDDRTCRILCLASCSTLAYMCLPDLWYWLLIWLMSMAFVASLGAHFPNSDGLVVYAEHMHDRSFCLPTAFKISHGTLSNSCTIAH